MTVVWYEVVPPELRSDRLTDTWVIVAEERSARPRDYRFRPEPKPAEQRTACAFCPGNEAMTPPETWALRDAGRENGPGWRVRVVPNKFPMLGPLGNPAPLGYALRRLAGVGSHEVVVEVPDHGKGHRARTPRAWADLGLALQARLRALAADPRVQYVLAFKNAGQASGASLEHPHSQVLAMPVVPDRVRRELQGLEHHHRMTDRCLLEDMLREELDGKARIVEAQDDFVLLCPFAARFPYELLLAPRTHAPRFEDAPRPQVEAFGMALGRALARLEAALQGSPFESYHFALHTAPAREKAEAYHWHCEVMPSLAFYAGFEKGTGMFVNHLGPERCAAELRALAFDAATPVDDDGSVANEPG